MTQLSDLLKGMQRGAAATALCRSTVVCRVIQRLGSLLALEQVSHSADAPDRGRRRGLRGPPRGPHIVEHVFSGRRTSRRAATCRQRGLHHGPGRGRLHNRALAEHHLAQHPL